MQGAATAQLPRPSSPRLRRPGHGSGDWPSFFATPAAKKDVGQRRSCRAAADPSRPPEAPSRHRPGKSGGMPFESGQAAKNSEAQEGLPARLILGGAAAAATVAAGIVFGTQIVESLESIPLLPQLEMLVGVAVSARAVTAYLADRRARSQMDERVASAMNELRDALGLPEEDTDSSLLASARHRDALLPSAAGELSMLEVEIRSIVDKSVDAAMGMDGPLPTAVTVDRKALIAAVAEYIRSREFQSKEMQQQLLDRLEASETIRKSLVELQKSKEARRARREAEASSWERLQKKTESQLAQAGMSDGGDSRGVADARPAAQGMHAAGSCEEVTQATAPQDSVDELALAMEKARKFRERLEAMKQSRQRRQQQQQGGEDEDPQAS